MPEVDHLETLLGVLRVLGVTRTKVYRLAEEADAREELLMLRQRANALAHYTNSDLCGLVRREYGDGAADRVIWAILDAVECVSARRTYLAWMLDEEDDRVLGREHRPSNREVTRRQVRPRLDENGQLAPGWLVRGLREVQRDVARNPTLARMVRGISEPEDDP